MSKVPGKGTYTPKFPDKYKGKNLPVIRSSWERVFCKWCDENPNIVAWGSEDIQIPYYDPTRRKNRRYFPDFVVAVIDKSKKIRTYLVEVKPHKETLPPIHSTRKSKKTLLSEQMTWNTNLAKWKAADNFCKKKGWFFKIITEKELFK